MSIVLRARPEIRELAPYSSARMEASGGTVMLNANESPWAGSGLNRYPDPQPAALVEALAGLYGVNADQVLAGRGSDEAIDLLVRAFCAARADAIVVCPPTFAMYGVCARIQGAEVIEVPLSPRFELDVDVLLAQVAPHVKLVFLCSPNNPTGGLVALTDIARIASALAERALVVVDEAYIEFAQAPSAVSLLAQHGNLAVLRTLSKAYALASARVGALIAAAEVIELLRRIQAPYPLAAPSVEAALHALDPQARHLVAAAVARTITAREQLRQQFAAMPAVQDVLPSHANFLCVRFAEAVQVYRQLLRRGVVVRDVSRYRGLAGHLRISIGTPDENARLLAALRMPVAAP
jgi:histidinol-phosphate aminotransferase